MATILPDTWVVTGQAIAGWFQEDREWLRLSDLAHSGSDIRHTPNDQTGGASRTERHDKLRARECLLVDTVIQDIQNGKIDLLIIARSSNGEWVEHVLPEQYLLSRQFRDALLSGQACKLRLQGSDVSFTDCDLCFRSDAWKKWKSGGVAKSVKTTAPVLRQFSVSELNKHFKNYVEEARKAGLRATERSVLVEMRRQVPGVTRRAVRDLLRSLPADDRARRGRPNKIAGN